MTEEFFGERVECNRTALGEDGADWLVNYCDLSPAVQSGQTPDTILDAARDNALGDARAILTDEQEITFEDRYPGRAIVGDANMRGIRMDGTYKARIFLVGTRMYRVAARVYNENLGNRLSMIDSFLDSFFIDTDLSVPFEPTP